jgi:hypothetical protein
MSSLQNYFPPHAVFQRPTHVARPLVLLYLHFCVFHCKFAQFISSSVKEHLGISSQWQEDNGQHRRSQERGMRQCLHGEGICSPAEQEAVPKCSPTPREATQAACPSPVSPGRLAKPLEENSGSGQEQEGRELSIQRSVLGNLTPGLWFPGGIMSSQEVV